MHHAFQKRPPENLILNIGLFIIGLIDNLISVNAFAHQLRCYLHSLRRSTGILKHTGIMCNSHIQSFCHPFTDLTAVQKCKNKFRRRTCVRQYVVQIGKGAVADMMINAQGFSRAFKQRGREAQTFRISAVKADKKIVFLFFRNLALHIIRTRNYAVRFRNFLQVNVCLQLRILLFQIHIKSKA